MAEVSALDSSVAAGTAVASPSARAEGTFHPSPTARQAGSDRPRIKRERRAENGRTSRVLKPF
jgi:hypothetical protein